MATAEIGYSGFSSVFTAYDLQRHEYTACELPRMSEGWADARKEAFVRHVERDRLHSRPDPVIHFDLKPANILSHDGEVKLSDLMRGARRGATLRSDPTPTPDPPATERTGRDGAGPARRRAIPGRRRR